MIVGYAISQPTLFQTLQELPSARIAWNKVDRTANDERLMVVWIKPDDFAAFESVVDDDPTATDPRILMVFSDQRLYYVEQSARGRALR